MVQVDRKEVCDFLNEKADTITLFVQKHEGLENVENVSFMAQGTKAYCYITLTSSGRTFRPKTLSDVLHKLGIVIWEEMHEEEEGYMFEILFFEAVNVTVWRSYTVTKAEAALRCIDDIGEVNDKYNVELRMRIIADEEHEEDQVLGCEYGHMFNDQIVEF